MASASAATGSPIRVNLSALLASLGAGSLCAIVATFVDQTRGLHSVLAAAGLVVAYFTSGQLLERIAMQLANSQGMILLMSGYLVRVGLIGLALWWAISSQLVATRFSSLWVGAGALSAVAGWLAGLIIAHSRTRIPVYDRPYVAPRGWDA